VYDGSFGTTAKEFDPSFMFASKACNNTHHYTDFFPLFIILQNVIMLSVILLNAMGL
jgi:hypothetical protein